MGLSIVPVVVSGVLGAASSIYQGDRQAKMYGAQAQAAENNAKIAQRQAAESVSRGAREIQRFRRDAGQFQASQESALAASGVTLSGSALNIMQDTAMGIEQDVETMRYNTLREKWGFDVQSVNFENEASAAMASAKNAKQAGYLGAAGSLIDMGAGIWDSLPIDAAVKGRTLTIGAR